MTLARIRAADWLLVPAALAVLTGAGAILAGRGPALALLLAALAGGISIGPARRGSTGRRLAAELIGPGFVVVGACFAESRTVGWFGLCVLVGWVALRARVVVALVAAGAAVAVFVVQLALVSHEPGWVTWIAGVCFTAGACVFARRERVLRERLQAADAELAQRARSAERGRIAREMHDLVGHSLTVTLLHLGSARLALADDPDAADLDAIRDCVAEAEQAARTSLEDVRAAVGLLRASGETYAGPAPTATDLPDLVESYRHAGVAVELSLAGDPAGLSAGRGLTAYRIVQESLTNAVRHGGGPIRVEVEVGTPQVRIAVRDAGPRGSTRARLRPLRSSVGSGAGGGTGLAAMRERARAVGGELSAGPDAAGWLVEAVLPV
ncbi:sensor histidine kinase [Granulicoccus phenolivorans]|uniref:sensor histidine kinase n=1 Tax=Granulicoccus phenolivorans TaxID=266854 RepID=UPI0004115761|nr:histidine kinase [Granulicoccus phenolivorans]